MLSRPGRQFTTRIIRSVVARSPRRGLSYGSNGLVYETLVEMQERACEKYKDRPFLGSRPQGGGPYEWITYEEFGEEVKKCRTVMHLAGVQPGDKVAVISSNRMEWAVAAYGAFSLGAAYVPMYEQQRVSECEYILKDSGAKLLLVSKERIYDKTRHLVGSIPTLKDSWCFDIDFEARVNNVDPAHYVPSHKAHADDLATLIYTSGTTGTPKGVKLSHRNLTTNIKGQLTVVPDSDIPNPKSVAFLPWAHCFGKTCELHTMLQKGAPVAIAEDLTTIVDALKEVKPTLMFAVPTLFKKVYDKIQEKVSGEGGLKKALIQRALNVAQERRMVRQLGGQPSAILDFQFNILDKLVLSKFREPFGGQLRASFIGGSAMPVDVGNFFENCGIAICEGYGLTETSPLIAVNSADITKRRLGTVGLPISGADVRIVKEGEEVPPGEEGEIWVRGPFVFKEYHNKPAETADTFGELNELKYFKTGDLGMMVEGGTLLKITGRIKELYKLENGKYVAPAVIEKALAVSEYFQQILVYGTNRPYNIVIIVPNWEKLHTWALENADGLKPDATKEDIGHHERVYNMLEAEIVTAAKDKVKKYELPTKFLLVKQPFTVDNELLTQKLSIKRHAVLKLYHDAVEAIYKDGHIKSLVV